ncbi:hypothetical protein [Chitinophaga defluvii]|uniref:TerB family tellurite resistance protein n=1 Tax=Chitinophaga defluvii TaxID=3163343 RepID=A0ABV2TCG3_9BACT
MKIIISILCLVTLMVLPARAQFLGGFFSQKKENRKLLGLQIAALEVYKSYIKKGYDIISNGVGIINKIKTGDFNLHRDFFGALKIVNPKIKKYAKVTQVMVMNVEAVTRLKQAGKLARSELIGSAQRQFLLQVIDHLLEILAGTIDELIAIITDNQLEMKDDERIARIDKIYIQAQEQCSFASEFDDQLELLVQMKKKKQAEIRGSEFLNGIEQP